MVGAGCAEAIVQDAAMSAPVKNIFVDLMIPSMNKARRRKPAAR
jgi:hypothetical protein